MSAGGSRVGQGRTFMRGASVVWDYPRLRSGREETAVQTGGKRTSLERGLCKLPWPSNAPLRTSAMILRA